MQAIADNYVTQRTSYIRYCCTQFQVQQNESAYGSVPDPFPPSTKKEKGQQCKMRWPCAILNAYQHCQPLSVSKTGQEGLPTVTNRLVMASCKLSDHMYTAMELTT